MTTPKYDTRRCTREALEAFATWWLERYPEEAPNPVEPVRRLRSEARIRTRAEIDREIGERLRGNASQHTAGSDCLSLCPAGKAVRDLVAESLAAPEEP